MKAKLGFMRSNAINHSGKKELVKSYKLIGYKNNDFHTPVDVRCYMGRSNNASVVYASIWVNDKEVCTTGTGQASGWGYDKQSAAISGALRSADITLTQRIDGVGDSAVREAILAIGKALKYRKMHISEVYGG